MKSEIDDIALLQNKIKEAIVKIEEQREEIITAFIAKYKVDPENAEQVIQFKGNKIIWYVRRRQP